MANGTMLVRFERMRRDRTGSLQERRSWVTVLTYRFSNKPLSVDGRFVNPLGFEVTEYRRSPEAPPLEFSSAPDGQAETLAPAESTEGSFQ
jgi:type IV secretion system protein VirB8